MAIALPAGAATFNVSNQGQLADAINAAQNGDAIADQAGVAGSSRS